MPLTGRDAAGDGSRLAGQAATRSRTYGGAGLDPVMRRCDPFEWQYFGDPRLQCVLFKQTVDPFDRLTPCSGVEVIDDEKLQLHVTQNRGKERDRDVGGVAAVGNDQAVAPNGLQVGTDIAGKRDLDDAVHAPIIRQRGDTRRYVLCPVINGRIRTPWRWMPSPRN